MIHVCKRHENWAKMASNRIAKAVVCFGCLVHALLRVSLTLILRSTTGNTIFVRVCLLKADVMVFTVIFIVSKFSTCMVSG